MKLRPARSARRARRSYLTAVTFRQHFPATLKIIRLLNKRGFSFRWLRQVSRGCDGARVNPGVASHVPWGKKVGLRPIREYGGRNIHRLLFRRSKQCNKCKFKLG